MAYVSRGSEASARRSARTPRLPLGPYLVEDFPVLSAGPTPRIPLEDWTFTIESEMAELKRWSWESFRALPSDEMGPTSTVSRNGRNWTRRGKASRSTRSSVAGVAAPATVAAELPLVPLAVSRSGRLSGATLVELLVLYAVFVILVIR